MDVNNRNDSFVIGTATSGIASASNAHARSPNHNNETASSRIPTATTTRRHCHFYKIGRCMYGNNCRYIHDDSIKTNKNNDNDNSGDNVSTSPSMDCSRSGDVIICRYFRNGYCRNGNNCPFSHDIHAMSNIATNNAHESHNLSPLAAATGTGNTCQPCKSNNDMEENNNDDDSQENNDQEHSETCSICFENIIQTKKRFGLLSDCNHIFCMDCIMTWRESYKNKNKQNQSQQTSQQQNNQRSTSNHINTATANASNTTNNNTTTNNNATFASNRTPNPQFNSMPPDIRFIQSMLNEIDFNAFNHSMLPPHVFTEMLIQSFVMSAIESQNSTSSTPNKSTTHSCPICRVESKYVIPSYHHISNSKEKEEYYEKYKESKKFIKCKHFDGNKGSCPFGKDCYFAHYDVNGVDVKESDYKRGSGQRGRRGRRNNNRRLVLNRMRDNDNDDDDDDDNSFDHPFGMLMEDFIFEVNTMANPMNHFRQHMRNHMESDDEDEQEFNPMRGLGFRLELRDSPSYSRTTRRPRRTYHEEDDDDSDSTGTMPDLQERFHDVDPSSSLSDDVSDSSMPRLQRRGGVSSSSDESSSSDDDSDNSMPQLHRRRAGMYNTSSDESSSSDDSTSPPPPLLDRRDLDCSSSDESSSSADDSTSSPPPILERRDVESSDDNSDSEDGMPGLVPRRYENNGSISSVASAMLDDDDDNNNNNSDDNNNDNCNEESINDDFVDAEMYSCRSEDASSDDIDNDDSFC